MEYRTVEKLYTDIKLERFVWYRYKEIDQTMNV